MFGLYQLSFLCLVFTSYHLCSVMVCFVVFSFNKAAVLNDNNTLHYKQVHQYTELLLYKRQCSSTSNPDLIEAAAGAQSTKFKVRKVTWAILTPVSEYN